MNRFSIVIPALNEKKYLIHRPIAPGPLTVVGRDVFELVGGYNEALTFGEDYDYTRRICARGITPQILRETLSVLSLRRVRKEGLFRRVIQGLGEGVVSFVLSYSVVLAVYCLVYLHLTKARE